MVCFLVRGSQFFYGVDAALRPKSRGASPAPEQEGLLV